MSLYALSIKQPWATLVVHGRKTIEVRSWATKRRGKVLIHAARQSDPRTEAWIQVPRELLPKTHLVGGIIGSVQLVDCIAYNTLERFQADQPLHLNEAGWYQSNGLYGFSFTQPKELPFRPFPGWVRFFAVPDSLVEHA